ncbi:glutathione S-transferase family protein [Roseibium salinum]|uniref:Glutathione S-transferase family protein n=1 Tax=Roseibium salinum TaxID=1604349 RepID=A0ABT3QZ42_9HYPH|nr:glutathione S-transferase family protein [Roseibium sp. DSM 29163]MCX2722108.1 glutathione S-transferase family protein [Roseibium sp. DSM 29163]MDN3719874.1 glutathione S-transferase family protein [Roseibium salinum]
MIELHGADYSVYVRAARLALEEKGIAYRLHSVDVFAPGGPPDDYLALHPFGRIPALKSGNFTLFETTAILRYIDEALDGPPLQPDTPEARARMTQIQSIMDGYAYRTLVWDIYVERVSKTRGGGSADEVRIASALGPARKIIAALEQLVVPGPFLLGEQLTLADCHAAPMLALFEKAEEGGFLLKAAPKLSEWLARFKGRASFVTSEPARPD